MLKLKETMSFEPSQLGYPDIIQGHKFYVSSQGFAQNLPHAIFGAALSPSEMIDGQHQLTRFGEKVVNTMRTNAGPLVDLGAGVVMPSQITRRFVPALAFLANVEYIGVDTAMTTYADGEKDVVALQLPTFPAWQFDSETYIQADMLAFLSQLEPLEDGRTYMFYMSGIQFFEPDRGTSRREASKNFNRQYIQACFAEIRRLSGSVILGFGISGHDIKPQYLEALGYRLDAYSE